MLEWKEMLSLLEAYDLTLVVVGLGVLGLATLLHRLEDAPFSYPILALALGYVAFALPLGLTPPDVHQHGAIAVHLTEIGVIISLMGVGLKIDRPPHWRTWSTTCRLLLICMPLTIACVALLGWWMVGLAPAAALLLGAAIAPTDPVLASDVQVGEPEAEEQPPSHDDHNPPQEPEQGARRPDEDELRFTLTSEAGLNDSLAFPFTYLSLHILAVGTAPSNWLVPWLLIDVAWRIVVGIAAGVAVGWILSRILLRLPVDSERERMTTGVGALAGTLILYGATECLGGYGFLAVFCGALTIKLREHTQQSHQSLHVFAEQSEQLLMTGILIALGGAIAGGLLAPLTWQGALLGVLLIGVLRPAAGLVSLLGAKRLDRLDCVIASFFGIRGIGCLYYLAYGLHKADFAQPELLWAICAFTITLSVVIHGITAAPVMRLRDRRAAGRTPAPAATR